MPDYKYDIEKLEIDHQELADGIQEMFPANIDDSNLQKHFRAMRNLHLDSLISATLSITERLEALVDAVDRNTAAIYDTAKPQARVELPGEEFDNAVMNRIGQLERDGYLATAKVLGDVLALIQKARQS